MRVRSTFVSMAAFLLGLPTVVLSWDGAVSGAVSSVEVNGTTQSFKVTISNVSSMCGNSNNWAYISVSDPNYSAHVAAILSAKSLGSTVAIYTTRDASGYCHIGDIISY
jgi:hypothetical protein